MVAINLPRSHEDWAPALRRDGARPHLPGGEPADLAPRPRALPDRATRVRRRRLAVLIAVLVLAVVVAVAVQVAAWLVDVGGSPSPEPLDGGRGAPVAGEQYVVQPGDTLWSIAAEIAPDRDPRPIVDALRAANGGPELEVGERLSIVLE
jgi:hypothetical protein